MQTVIIVIHLLIVIALVGVVLIQRSEGGGLGLGGGSGFMTARGTRNALTRITAILAAAFFLTSLILTGLQVIPHSGHGGSVWDELGKSPAAPEQAQPAAPDANQAPPPAATPDTHNTVIPDAGKNSGSDSSRIPDPDFGSAPVRDVLDGSTVAPPPAAAPTSADKEQATPPQ